MKNIYVQAIVELLASGLEVEVMLSRAKAVMEAHGHGRLYVAVLTAVVASLEESSVSIPKVRVARIGDASSLEVIRALTLLNCANIAPLIKVEDTLIGGVVATQGHRHIDMSYKTTLQKLYRAINA